VLDIDSENRMLRLEQLQHVHRMKTGALLRSACRLGAIAARASDAQLAAISEFGRQLGLAFQIVDDLLDVTSTPQQMGKATQKDAKAGKNTYPSLIGIEPSRKAAQEHIDHAVQALADLGAGADGLRNLARFVAGRSW
jgi:geranylgeranyl diphosphate synthase, type II